MQGRRYGPALGDKKEVVMKDKKTDETKDDEKIRMEDLDLTLGAKALLMLSANS